MAFGGLNIYKLTPPLNTGGIPYVSTRFSQSIEMSRLTRDGTAEPVSRDQILRREGGQGNIHFPCPADHEQDWQAYLVDPSLAIYVMTIHTYCTYIHTYIWSSYVPPPSPNMFVFAVFFFLNRSSSVAHHGLSYKTSLIIIPD